MADEQQLGPRVWLVGEHELALPQSPELGGGVVRVVVAPHPSGRSRLWNDPEMRPRVRAMVEALRAGTPPR